jgi:hypothetical protein
MDESEYDGILASILIVLRRAHELFFDPELIIKFSLSMLYLLKLHVLSCIAGSYCARYLPPPPPIKKKKKKEEDEIGCASKHSFVWRECPVLTHLFNNSVLFHFFMACMNFFSF